MSRISVSYVLYLLILVNIVYSSQAEVSTYDEAEFRVCTPGEFDPVGMTCDCDHYLKTDLYTLPVVGVDPECKNDNTPETCEGCYRSGYEGNNCRKNDFVITGPDTYRRYKRHCRRRDVARAFQYAIEEGKVDEFLATVDERTRILAEMLDIDLDSVEVLDDTVIPNSDYRRRRERRRLELRQPASYSPVVDKDLRANIYRQRRKRSERRNLQDEPTYFPTPSVVIPNYCEQNPNSADCECAFGEYKDSREIDTGVFTYYCNQCDLGSAQDQVTSVINYIDAELGIAGCPFCQAGTFARGYGSYRCAPCAPGSYTDGEQYADCLLCPVDTYQPEYGSTECFPCADGSGTNGQYGAAECISDVVIEQLEVSSCSASSEWGPSYACEFAYVDVNAQWATANEGIGSWIQYSFADQVTITSMHFQNRVCLSGTIQTDDCGDSMRASLEFSDNQFQEVYFEDRSGLNEITLEPVRTTFVKMTIIDVYSTVDNGAQILQFFGYVGEATTAEPYYSTEDPNGWNINTDIPDGQTCSEGERIDTVSTDVETCQTMANLENADYIYWQSAQERNDPNGNPLCHIYESCNELRSPDMPGTNYVYAIQQTTNIPEICPVPTAEFVDRVGTEPGECSPNCSNRCCINQNCQMCYTVSLEACANMATVSESCDDIVAPPPDNTDPYGTCGSRWRFLMSNDGRSENDAKCLVKSESPDLCDCLACDLASIECIPEPFDLTTSVDFASNAGSTVTVAVIPNGAQNVEIEFTSSSQILSVMIWDGEDCVVGPSQSSCTHQDITDPLNYESMTIIRADNMFYRIDEATKDMLVVVDAVEGQEGNARIAWEAIDLPWCQASPVLFYEEWDCSTCVATEGFTYCEFEHWDSSETTYLCLPTEGDNYHVPCGQWSVTSQNTQWIERVVQECEDVMDEMRDFVNVTISDTCPEYYGEVFDFDECILAGEYLGFDETANRIVSQSDISLQPGCYKDEGDSFFYNAFRRSLQDEIGSVHMDGSNTGIASTVSAVVFTPDANDMTGYHAEIRGIFMGVFAAPLSAVSVSSADSDFYHHVVVQNISPDIDIAAGLTAVDDDLANSNVLPQGTQIVNTAAPTVFPHIVAYQPSIKYPTAVPASGPAYTTTEYPTQYQYPTPGPSYTTTEYPTEYQYPTPGPSHTTTEYPTGRVLNKVCAVQNVFLVASVDGVSLDNMYPVAKSIANVLNGTVIYCGLSDVAFRRQLQDESTLDVSLLVQSEPYATGEYNDPNFIDNIQSVSGFPAGVTINNIQGMLTTAPSVAPTIAPSLAPSVMPTHKPTPTRYHKVFERMAINRPTAEKQVLEAKVDAPEFVSNWAFELANASLVDDEIIFANNTYNGDPCNVTGADACDGQIAEPLCGRSTEPRNANCTENFYCSLSGCVPCLNLTDIRDCEQIEEDYESAQNCKACEDYTNRPTFEPSISPTFIGEPEETVEPTWEEGSGHGDPIIWTFHGECYDLNKDGTYLASSVPRFDHDVYISVYNDYMREINVVDKRSGKLLLSINNLGDVINDNYPFHFEKRAVPCTPEVCDLFFTEYIFDAQDFEYRVQIQPHDYLDPALEKGQIGMHLDIYPRVFRAFYKRIHEYFGLYFFNPLPGKLGSCPAK